MSQLESRMGTLVLSTKEDIKTNVNAMKKDIVVEIKQDINSLVDQRSKVLEDRKRREMNLVFFNLKEHSHVTGHLNKQGDEEDIKTICSSLGLENVEIVTLYRIGKRSGKSRPLKVILKNKNDRKFLIDNARFIPEKASPEFREVIITKDLTPDQWAEKIKLIQNRKINKKKTLKIGIQTPEMGRATISYHQ